jgi:hypothetical protein
MIAGAASALAASAVVAPSARSALRRVILLPWPVRLIDASPFWFFWFARLRAFVRSLQYHPGRASAPSISA